MARASVMEPRFQHRVWLVVIPAMILPFAASLFYFVLFTEHLFARWVYALTKVFTVVWPVISVVLILRTGFPKLDPRADIHRRALAAGVATGTAIVGLMFVLMLTPVGEVVMAGAPKIRNKTHSLGILSHYWAFGLFLSLVHSLIEEFYWRWFVFGHLRLLVRATPAHLLAGAAFAAHHVVVATQYFPFAWGLGFGCLCGVGGIIWSVMYEKQRSLAGAWVSHILVDLGILSIGHRLLFGSYF